MQKINIINDTMLAVVFLGFVSLILPDQLHAFSEATSPKVFFYKSILDFDPKEWTVGETLDSLYGENTSNASIVYVQLRCEAPFPIRWNVSGFILPQDLNLDSPNKKRSVFSIWFGNKYINIKQAALQIRCEMVGNSDVMTERYLFKQYDDLPDLVEEIEEVDEFRNVTDSRLIPCPTSNPTEPVHLYLEHSNGSKTSVRDYDSSLQYHPTEGFRSENVFHGNYLCRQNKSSVFIKAKSTNEHLHDFNFFPLARNVKSFVEDSIQLECFSKSEQPVKIIFNDTSYVKYVEYVDHSNNDPTYSFPVLVLNGSNQSDNEMGDVSKYVAVSNYNTPFAAMSKVTLNIGKAMSVFGEAACVTADSNGKQKRVKKWLYEFIETPTLQLSNYRKQIHCQTTEDKATLKTIECLHGYNCDFLKSHGQKRLLSERRLGIRETSRFTACDNSGCVSYRLKKCYYLPYTHPSGLIQWSVGELIKEWEFFESLTQRKYTNWKDVPREELVNLVVLSSSTSNILYTNETTEFLCEAVTYFFTKPFVFQIEYRNKTREILEENENNIIINSCNNSRLIENVNSVWTLALILPEEAVGIHCIAYFWNSTETVESSKNFETRHLRLPYFTSGYGDGDDASTQKEIFYVGETNRRLVCPGKGEPQVEYEWSFENTSVVKALPELQLYLGSEGQSYLHFPDISSSSAELYSGEYRCVTSNSLGSIKRVFNLKIEDRPTSWLYFFLPVTAVGILVLVVVLLLVYRRRYKMYQAELRNLTDREMTDFFEGRPEIGRGNMGHIDVDTVDFLPYNKDYEIPLSDLSFTCTDNQMLGSGEFAFVVRGLILSKGKPVALKISKPSTDVIIFKSLLSEVKIMSFIGDHENVMALVGVCTEGIKTRSIYIATEICHFGSLNGFLRKSRPFYVSLLNSNQEIDINMKPENITDLQVTTLDLLSFASQIAKGMEYLAYKSVIHADLATRNVLLTGAKVAKISDFGLSKKLYENNNYVKTSRSPLPWRWMALESLQTLTFSTQSDVWAYGVTLYEIFTLGDAPFANEEWNLEFVKRLEEGMRMGRPKYSTKEIYSQFMSCWENDPAHRPDFASLRVFFEALLKKHSNSTPENENQFRPHLPSLENTFGEETEFDFLDENPSSSGNQNYLEVVEVETIAKN